MKIFQRFNKRSSLKTSAPDSSGRKLVTNSEGMNEEQRFAASSSSMESMSTLESEIKFSVEALQHPPAFDWSQSLPTTEIEIKNRGEWIDGIACDVAGLSDEPTKAWGLLCKQGMSCTKVDVSPLESSFENDQKFLRIVCISDTHGKESNIPEGSIPDGDILIHAGDFTRSGQAQEIRKFAEWFASQQHRHKILIAGNHDICLQPDFYDTNFKRFGHMAKYDSGSMIELLRNHPGFVYLEDESVVIENYKFYGSPWQPTFCNWAFNLPRGEKSRKVWRKIPSDTEILITHGPPLGYGDTLNDRYSRAGCLDLLREVQSRIQPMHHVFGHIHESHGSTTDGVTQYHNASTCSDSYHPNQPALFFDVPVKEDWAV